MPPGQSFEVLAWGVVGCAGLWGRGGRSKSLKNVRRKVVRKSMPKSAQDLQKSVKNQWKTNQNLSKIHPKSIKITNNLIWGGFEGFVGAGLAPGGSGAKAGRWKSTFWLKMERKTVGFLGAMENWKWIKNRTCWYRLALLAPKLLSGSGSENWSEINDFWGLDGENTNIPLGLMQIMRNRMVSKFHENRSQNRSPKSSKIGKNRPWRGMGSPYLPFWMILGGVEKTWFSTLRGYRRPLLGFSEWIRSFCSRAEVFPAPC